MNVVVWARVSSREQKEGYSLDAQVRITRERAAREGWNIIREFTIAESAKRGADREEFNRMYRWLKKNARKEKIGALLAHKLDRICRNMRDAVRMQELEDDCGVKLAFVENEFGPGAAGALSFNVMAAVAQYYSDNLQGEVIKGMDEKVRQGWLPGHVPYGYVNVKDNKEEPIVVDPEKARAVVRVFELYAKGEQTYETLTQLMKDEGYIFRPTMPLFTRSALSYILNNRFYTGVIEWKGKIYPGKHKPLIHRSLFEACQDILHGRNRRIGIPEIPYAGGLFRCAYCGSAITGEEIRRKRKDGSVRVHYYYKCRNTSTNGHPKLRWRAEDLDKAIQQELRQLAIPDQETADWFREAVEAAFGCKASLRREQNRVAKKRIGELTKMQERCLNAYISGSIDEPTFEKKKFELKTEIEELEKQAAEEIEDPTAGKTALAVYNFSQKAHKIWLGSNFSIRRAILDCISSNRTLDNASLYVSKRSPFDVLAERAFCSNGRGDRI